MGTEINRLLERMEQEIIELYKAVQDHKAGRGTAQEETLKRDVILECADVANHCAMIADKYGLFESEVPS